MDEVIISLETDNSILLIDEKKGRRIASEMGLRVMGTLRVLIIAKEKGIITSLKASLEALLEAGFRLSPKLIQEILEQYDA